MRRYIGLLGLVLTVTLISCGGEGNGSNTSEVKITDLEKLEPLKTSENNENLENNFNYKKLKDRSSLLGKWVVNHKVDSQYFEYEIYENNSVLISVTIGDTVVIRRLAEKGDKYYEYDFEHRFYEYVTIGPGGVKLYGSDGPNIEYVGTLLK